jgi:hypothetical protein
MLSLYQWLADLFAEEAEPGAISSDVVVRIRNYLESAMYHLKQAGDNAELDYGKGAVVTAQGICWEALGQGKPDEPDDPDPDAPEDEATEHRHGKRVRRIECLECKHIWSGVWDVATHCPKCERGFTLPVKPDAPKMARERPLWGLQYMDRTGAPLYSESCDGRHFIATFLSRPTAERATRGAEGALMPVPLNEAAAREDAQGEETD